MFPAAFGVASGVAVDTAVGDAVGVADGATSITSADALGSAVSTAGASVTVPSFSVTITLGTSDVGLADAVLTASAEAVLVGDGEAVA